jgi:hypothetical protein
MMVGMRSEERVVIARGSSESELRQAAEALYGAGIPFDVEEGLVGSPDTAEWRWQLHVLAHHVEPARGALSAEPPRPRGDQPGPGPLFDSRAGEVLRVGLMLASFSLAGGLWLQTCVS